MPTLKYLGDSFECSIAIKGADYIHLLDENGFMVASFEKISDFDAFTLEGGSYTSPTADNDCLLAVVRDDGTLGKGDHTCADIGRLRYVTEDTAAMLGLEAPATVDSAIASRSLLIGTGSPTATTAASIGQFYWDSAKQMLWSCTRRQTA